MRDDRLISLNAAIKTAHLPVIDDAGYEVVRVDDILALPSAQLNLSEAYSKAVFTWLRDYQIRAAELKGRYTPYEVLSWVANDWRKEHERSD